jgi:phosphoribosylaminoimidazolecarboxamide formyltransferase/IMP cyclohydrolase
VIGVGAGQQSRIACTRLAAEKAELWWLRQHPTLESLAFSDRASRPERDNILDAVARGEPLVGAAWMLSEGSTMPRLSAEERADWLSQLRAVSMTSDGLIPFRDTIDRAARSGVEFVAQPGGSLRDADVVGASEEHGMAMTLTGIRLFHH